jgi:L-rhamnose isomerase
VENVWIPDGYKDIPVDRRRPRELLTESLNAIFAEKIDKEYLEDSVESKLFGIGSESYVVGSHDFYVGYAMNNDVLYTIDTGHFHPTESTADKLSALFNYFDELFFHISRGVRWDSDHVVLFNDDVQSLTGEMVRGDYLERVRIGLDFFDASINRVAAWIIGSRSVLKSLLYSLLEPVDRLKEFERSGDFTSRLAYLEELKTLPFGAVWDYYCKKQDVPVSTQWLDEVKQYERDVLANRG